MEKLKVIFVGTGDFGVPILEALFKDRGVEIPLVITGMDKPAGRGMKMTFSPIKQAATSNKLIVHQCSKIAGLKQKIMQTKPDFLLVVAFGEIIPVEILKLAKFGAINVHGSLLPQYRGASPIQEALLRGDSQTGVTWILMEKKMDAGAIVSQEKILISNEDTAPSLFEKLSLLAAKHTPSVLRNFADSGEKKSQDEAHASYCRKIKKSDGLIEPQKENARDILNKIRAYNPWPGCFFFWNGKRIKLVQAKLSEQKNSSDVIATKNGLLQIERVQPESKKEMAFSEFLRGQK